MNNLVLYILKVTAVTTLLYLCYLLLFSRDTFYLRNRIFLILTLLLPALIPAIKIPVTTSNPLPESTVYDINNIIFSEATSNTTVTTIVRSDTFDYNSLFLWIYLTIAGALILRVLISLFSTYRIIKKGVVKDRKFPKVVISGLQLPPFSFFPYAVIPGEEFNNAGYNDILDHEFAHIRQGHTFDLLLCEIFVALEWFNPFVWLIKRSIVSNHEYLADQVSLSNKSIKEYQYKLLNFNKGLKNISLAHNFNSLIKNRIIMINKKPTRKLARLKNILILPVALLVVYAFATPEYHYAPKMNEPLSIIIPPEIIQKEVRGVILNEDGKPLANVVIKCTGTPGNVTSANSGSDGRFTLGNVPEDSYLIVTCRGYLIQTIKSDINSEMVIKMVRDPDYKESQSSGTAVYQDIQKKPLVVLDGVVSDQTTATLITKLGPEFGTVISLRGKEATDKYGEAGKNGVEEVYSRKKAIELGLKFPFRRNTPDEYPTFQGESYTTFNKWVIEQIKYPTEASAKGIGGRISVTYTVEADGSVDRVSPMGTTGKLLSEAVVNVVLSSPKWEPAGSPDARVPFTDMVRLKFVSPDKVLPDDALIMAEEMPMYPGGDGELLKFISNNTKYSDEAKAQKLEGRVILRFIVNTQGNAEEATVLKGVHPLLDDEALRVVSMLSGFKPGMQGGKPVSIYYMVPVTFKLPQADTVK